jgi:CoA:oxalate CoA-transferase
MVVSTDTESGRSLQMAGNPIKLSAHEDPATREAAPALDGDRQRILAELDARAPRP